MAQIANLKSLITCLVAGSQYLLHPEKLGSIQETINPDALLPVTLLDTHEIFGDVEGTLKQFGRRDDVFVPEFGFVLVEKPGGNSSGAAASLDGAAAPGRALYRLRDDVALMDGGRLARLPSGPYFLHGPNLYEAWRLYDDEADAFARGVIPETVKQAARFRALGSLSESGAHRSVAVPSRLYHARPSEEKPLSGLRVAVPDAVALGGVSASLSSRSWRLLHASPADATAALAQRLLDLGAVIVGQTKSSQFGSGRDWVDDQAPWNPRGDGYQCVGGGAAGAGTATASYKWLAAVAFGLDDIDGVGGPAAAHGLFALRTTPGSVPPARSGFGSQPYDSVGLMSRALPELVRVASALSSQSGSDDVGLPLPGRLVYPADMAGTGAPEADRKLASLFLRALEGASGLVADRVNVTAAWAGNPPPEANGQGLQAYLRDSAFRSFCYDFYHRYDDFKKAYQDKFQQPPYAEASIKYRWDVGKNVSKPEYDEHRKRIDVFRTWFNRNIVPTNSSSDAWTAVVLPVLSEAPRYRDEPLGTPTSPSGITPELLPWMLQAPQVLVPFAQQPYVSRVSARTEHRVVCGSVMGRAGGDLAAVHLVQRALEGARWRTHVDAGRLAFPEAYLPPDAGEARGRAALQTAQAVL